MPERAKVSSIEALEAFRASLIVYLEKARGTLDEISDDVTRTRVWVQDDRWNHWQREVRRRTRELEDKQQALFGSRLSSLQQTTQAEQAAVYRAKRALDEARAKFDEVKRWNRQYDNRVQPLAKEVDKLRDVLTQHMGKGLAYLTQTLGTLGAYAELRSPTEAAPASAATDSGAGKPTGTEAGNS